MIAQGVADIVEAGGMGELGEEQRDDVAPGGEGAGLLVDAILRGEFRSEVGGYELADLGEDRQLCLGWFMIFHQADPEWDRPPVTLFQPTYGTAVRLFVNSQFY